MNKKLLRKTTAIIASAVTVTAAMPSVLTANAADAWTKSIKSQYKVKTAEGKDTVSGKTFTFDISYRTDNKADYYYDPDRNIMVNDVTSTKGGISSPRKSESAIICRSDSSLNETDVFKNNKYKNEMDIIMFNVERAYDFFEDLGYTGYSRMGDNNIYVTINDVFSGNKLENGAISMNGVLRFGSGDKIDYYCLARAYDVVAHEYTHMVTQHKLGWDTYSTDVETCAIMEAYSDIMAELGEESPNWKIGTEVSVYNFKNNPGRSNERCERNIIDPESTGLHSLSGENKKYYSDYSDFLKDVKDKSVTVSGGQGSTVISHAAYLMYETGDISKNDLAKLWYTSIDMFKDMPINPKEARFIDVKTALLKANEKLFNGDKKKRDIINEAFSKVGISGYGAYTDTTDPTSQIAMDTFVASRSRAYMTGSSWMCNSFNTGTFADMNHPDTCYHSAGTMLCGSVATSAMVEEGFKKFDYYNEEPYSQCAGFARLMQMEYFNTTKFMRLGQYSVIQPMLGDHFRYDTFGGNDHSIFVTGIEYTSPTECEITYADCNATGNCTVEWFKTLTLYSDWNGWYLMIQDPMTRTREKSYIKWVERPIRIGDTNCDSFIDDRDMAALSNLLNYYDNYNSSSVDIEMRDNICDVNRDGKLDEDDFSSLKSIRARYSTYFKTHGYIR